MDVSTTKRLMVISIAVLFSMLTGQVNAAQPGQLISQIVLTEKGEMIGRVEDLSVDLATQRVNFVVVSVGSFVVEDNLIAVHPQALTPAEDGGYWVVRGIDLEAAQRFSAQTWPATVEVPQGGSPAPNPQTGGPSGAASEPDIENSSVVRMATISDGLRTATVQAGARPSTLDSSARQSEDGAPIAYKRFTDGALPSYMADSEFETLDEDFDGYLSRDEIGVRLRRARDFDEFDLDDNNGIDRFEFQLIKEE